MATKQQQTRRERAQARQQAAADRTPQEQLRRLDAAGLVAVRERMKLAKKIQAASTKRSGEPLPSIPQKNSVDTEKKKVQS